MSEDLPTIILPWKFCAQANHRLMPVIRGGRAIVITAPPYRQAKESAELSIKRQWGRRAILTAPLAVIARCYFPDRRRRDASNLSKMLGDAMSGIVYEDDSQVHRETYERTGIDRANPRVVITITPLTPITE